MNKMYIGKNFKIQAYKHNGTLRGQWDEAVLIKKCKDYLIFGNNRTLVTEANGSKWKTKEPAIMYFFYKEWFNIIVQFKKDGIYYYCNIGTPFIIEDNTIKYIDYDLDLRIFSNGAFKILDNLEFNHNKRIMQYSKKLDECIHIALDTLIKLYKENYEAFDKEKNINLYKKNNNLKNSILIKNKKMK